MPNEIRVTPKILSEFGYIMAIFIAGIFGLLIPLLKDRELPRWPWIVALLFVVAAARVPYILTPLYRGWMRFGRALGAVNSRIVLAILFWGVVTPLSLLLKLAGRDALKLKYRDHDLTTYRVPPVTVDPKSGMEKPF